MSYIICAESQYRDGHVVFMADRKKVDKSVWWTDDLQSAFEWKSFEAAWAKAETLHYGDPKVLTLAEAKAVAMDQEDEDCQDDGSWDDHKGYF